MVEQSLLHTDLLEKQFGPIHIVVRKHDSEERIVDIVDNNGVCKTHAVTRLSKVNEFSESNFRETVLEIENGASLGKTFKKHNFDIEKGLIIQGKIIIPDRLMRLFESDHNLSNFRIYEFIAIDRGGVSYPYGVIYEIDSPDFQGNMELGPENIEEPINIELINNHLLFLKEYLK